MQLAAASYFLKCQITFFTTYQGTSGFEPAAIRLKALLSFVPHPRIDQRQAPQVPAFLQHDFQYDALTDNHKVLLLIQTSPYHIRLTGAGVLGPRELPGLTAFRFWQASQSTHHFPGRQQANQLAQVHFRVGQVARPGPSGE